MAFQAQAQPAAVLSKTDYDRVIANPDDDQAFQTLLERLPRIRVGEAPGRIYYVLEGDLLLSEGQVRSTFKRYNSDPKPVLPNGELLVMTANGQPVYWPVQARALTYTIDTSGFTPTERKLVETTLKKATDDWVQACTTCRLTFTQVTYRPGTPGDATFHVAKVGDEGGFIAASFFPNDPLDQRVLQIAPLFFRLGVGDYDPVGALRHEIGHILGYRHEQIQGVPGCEQEDNHWKPLTRYDAHSVMHYFCGGSGTLKLELSDLDKAGHKKAYGTTQ